MKPNLDEWNLKFASYSNYLKDTKEEFVLCIAKLQLTQSSSIYSWKFKGKEIEGLIHEIEPYVEKFETINTNFTLFMNDLITQSRQYEIECIRTKSHDGSFFFDFETMKNNIDNKIRAVNSQLIIINRYLTNLSNNLILSKARKTYHEARYFFTFSMFFALILPIIIELFREDIISYFKCIFNI